MRNARNARGKIPEDQSHSKLTLPTANDLVEFTTYLALNQLLPTKWRRRAWASLIGCLKGLRVLGEGDLEETFLIRGEPRGTLWATRKKNKAYWNCCLDPIFKRRSGFMVWGTFSAGKRNPCRTNTIARLQHRKELFSSMSEIAMRITTFNWSCSGTCSTLGKLLSLFRSEERRQTRPDVSIERRKKTKGSVDQYLYLTDVLRPKLLPPYREII